MKRLLVLFALFAVLVPLSLFIPGCGDSPVKTSSTSTTGPDKQKEMQQMMEKGKARNQP